MDTIDSIEYRYFVAKVSHHTHTIRKRAELMSKTYKNGFFKKSPYKSPKIRTCTDKSVQVGTLRSIRIKYIEHTSLCPTAGN